MNKSVESSSNTLYLFLKKVGIIISVVIATVTIGMNILQLLKEQKTELLTMSQLDKNKNILLADALYFSKVEGFMIKSRVSSLESMFEKHCSNQDDYLERIIILMTKQEIVLNSIKDMQDDFQNHMELYHGPAKRFP